MFGLFKSSVKSPINGFVESISAITGQVMLREPPIPIELSAYVDGVVTEVTPDREVFIETHGCLIQGIFGIGGEAVGTLRMIAKSPSEKNRCRPNSQRYQRANHRRWRLHDSCGHP